jgi:tetratricopeptide (TPR) repeat protein
MNQISENIAVVLDRLGDQPDRYEQIRKLLNDPQRREEYSDHAEELLQQESARYSTAMLERAGFYAELVSRESKRLKGKEQLDALTVMNEQFPRIVEAIENAMSLDDSACLAKFAASVVSLLHMQGKLELGASVFKRLLNQAKKTGNRPLEVRAGRYYGQFLTDAGKLDKAYKILLHALGLALLEGNESELAKVQIALGNVTRYQGRYEESVAFYKLALENGRKLRDKYLISGALCSLGLIALGQCRLDDARRLFAESLEIARKTGNIYRIAGDLHNLACVAVDQGDYDAAQKLYQEALELNRLIGNRTFEARNLHALGNIALDQGHLNEAKQLYSSAQAIAAETGNELDYARCEGDLGNVAAAMGSFEDARRHFEKSMQLSQTSPYCSCDWR